jgi:PAS domain S-box-containing protein
MERQAFLGLWSVGFALNAVRLMIEFAWAPGSEAGVVVLGAQVTAFLGGVMLVWGTHGFLGRPLPRIWSALVVIGLFWIGIGVMWDLSFTVISFPISAFLGIAYIWTGVELLRSHDFPGAGIGIAGTAFVLWGVHKLNYPIMRQIEWFAPWGFLIASVLTLMVTFGILLAYFMRVHLLLRKEVSAHREDEEALIESESRYRALFASDLVGVSIVNREGRFMAVNKAYARMLGYVESALVGMRVVDVSHADEMGENRRLFRETVEGERTQYRMEKKYVRSDGAVIWGDLAVFAVVDDRGHFKYCFATIVDITERKLSEQRIAASLREKEVLLREIHHRVKNNMQIITSLLNLQASKIREPEVLMHFDEACNRIRSMALVHERLYRSKDFASIDLETYIHALIDHLVRTCAPTPGHVRKSISIMGGLRNIDAIVPLGLIINELVSNCLKHAFRSDRGGVVSVSFREEGDERILVVADDGSGLPPDFSLGGGAGTLGIQIVAALVEQLGGTITFDRTGGARFFVRFTEPRDYPVSPG